MRVLALRPRPFALACLLCFSIVRLPSPASAQSLDISDPPCGLAADTALGATRYTNVKFHHYKVPVTVSRRANRDYEFLWSDTYRSVLHMPLDTLTGTPARTDIDRLALTACEEWWHNPFGLNQTDVQLAYNFLAQRQTLDSMGVPVERRATYDSDPFASIGFRVAQPDDPEAERTHIDAYIFGRQFGGYGSDPSKPWYDGWNGDGWQPGQNLIRNYGKSPSDYEWAANEDSSTGSGFYHGNSLQIPGPYPTQVGSTNSATRWTRPGGTANSQLIHESLHAINYDHGRGTKWLHMFASGAEAVTGVATDPPTSDVDYRFSLTPGPGGDLLSAAYSHWQSFMAYLTFNFRGADTTAASYLDDLVPRWAREDAAQRSLLGLARRLRNVECPECVTYPGFADIDSVDRVTRLIHDWRVAAYVNNPGLAGGHYGFPVGYGFSPAVQLGAWQNVNGVSTDDWAVAPPETTLAAADRGHTSWITERPPGVPDRLRKLRLGMFGAEYFIFHAAAALTSTQQTLHLRLHMPELLRSTAVLSPVARQCDTTLGSGRITASVVRYSQSADSLFRHPDWATSVTTVSTELDSARGDLVLEVPDFGPQTKAALLVITLGDGPKGLYSRFDARTDTPTDSCTIELGVSLVPAGAPSTPHAVGGTGGTEQEPSWSPDGSKLAFRRTDGSGVSRLYSAPSDGSGTPALLRPETTGQFEPSWSPRGDAVAYAQQSASDRHLWLVNPATGTATQLTSATGIVRSPAFSPTGAKVGYVREWSDSSATHWEVRLREGAGSGDELLTAFAGDSAVVGLRWTGDGRHLLFTRYDPLDEARHLYQLHVPTHELTIHDAQAPDALIREYSPGAGPLLVEEVPTLSYPLYCEWPWAAIYCGCQPGGTGYIYPHWIALRDTLAGRSRPIAHRAGAVSGAPRFSPDGTKVAYVTTQNGNPDVYVAPVTFNRAPAFTSATTYYLIGDCSPFSLPLSATDPDGDPLTREVFDLPAGAVLQGDGTLHWESPVMGHHWLIARVLDSQGAVASKVVHLDVVSAGPCGGGGGEGGGDEPPILPGGGNSARQAEASRLIGGLSGPPRAANTFLDGAASGAWTAQVARLVAAQADSTGHVRSQFVALRPGQLRLDRARLLVVDHAPGTVAVAAGGGVAVGRKQRLTSLTAAGEELAALRTGGPGAARQFVAGTAITMQWQAADSLAGLVVDCARAGAVDASGAWGLRLDVEHEGLWQPVGRIHPRSAYDALAVALPPGASGLLRLVCESDTYVREIAGYSLAAGGDEAATVTAVEVDDADREGAVASLAAADSSAVELAHGQRLAMQFAGPAPVADGQRTLFLDFVASFTPEGAAEATDSRVTEAAPVRFALRGNRPNPFGGGTTIRFDVPIPTRVKLEVFDAQGRRVRVLADASFAPGEHALAWDGTDAAGQRVRPGVYLYRMSAGAFREQRRMVLLGR